MIVELQQCIFFLVAFPFLCIKSQYQNIFDVHQKLSSTLFSLFFIKLLKLKQILIHFFFQNIFIRKHKKLKLKKSFFGKSFIFNMFRNRAKSMGRGYTGIALAVKMFLNQPIPFFVAFGCVKFIYKILTLTSQNFKVHKIFLI